MIPPVRPASDGERSAASGFHRQYAAAAQRIVEALSEGTLDEVRIADPAAGQLDDIQIVREGRVDAYQVKWEQYPGVLTLGDVQDPRRGERPLLTQLADGWQRLQREHPTRRIVVHLLTNAFPSTSRSVAEHPDLAGPTHFAAFVARQWEPVTQGQPAEDRQLWADAWDGIRTSTGLAPDNFERFLSDCVWDLATPTPPADPDVDALAALLFKTAADPQRLVRLSRSDLLARLGWATRYAYRNRHEFGVPRYYQPIESTVARIANLTEILPGGYVAVVGPPGSGKSTLLTETLRELPVRLVRYYAFVREAGDPTALRGEAVNFLHDVTLRLYEAGVGDRKRRPDPGDRTALSRLFHEQLAWLGNDAQATGTQTMILIDGLDHIDREQQPERSLLNDLPSPDAVPDGVFVVLGTQRTDLDGLPAAVRHAVATADRRVEVSRLSPAAVDAVLRETLPSLGPDDRSVLAERSGGHPLALIYLVKQVQQAATSSERDRVVQEAVSYDGDIEAYYAPYWDAIADADLEHALALLARTRGAIDIAWAAAWMGPAVSRALDRSFGPYFDRDAAGGWTFFHNSFRLFLQARTGQSVFGLPARDSEQTFHRELAAHYAERPDALYHLVEAGETIRALSLATDAWFLAQAHALRPLDAVRADIALAVQAASTADSPLALTRLLLLSADLEQRSFYLADNHPVAERLVDLGEVTLAIAAARDGDRLRIEPVEALRLAVRLAEAGSHRQAARLFELAEPHELFSGRTVDDHPSAQVYDLLDAWADAAPRFRGPADVLRKVAGVRQRADRHATCDEAVSAADRSLDVQRWLLGHVAAAAEAIGDRSAWWRTLRALHALGRGGLFDLLLGSAHAAHAGSDRQRHLLGMLLRRFTPVDGARGPNDIDRYLDVAGLALDHNDPATADLWTRDLVPLPLSPRHPGGEASPVAQRFRLYGLRYALGEPRHPDLLVQQDADAAPATMSNEGVDAEGTRLAARAATTLGSLWGRGRRGERLPPAAFMRDASWVMDAHGTFHPSATRLLWQSRAASPELMDLLVQAAAEHGHEVLGAVVEAFEHRWERGDGTPTLRRRVARALAAAGASDLGRQVAARAAAEPPDARPRDRAEARFDQATTWLHVDDPGAARDELVAMVDAARGVLDDHDHQLEVWVRWMDRANAADPGGAGARIRTMLRRLVAVEGEASGVVEAGRELVRAATRWSPRQAVYVVQALQLYRVLDHETAVSAFLETVVGSPHPPADASFHTALRLLVPLGGPGSSQLVPSLLAGIAAVHGDAGAVSAARHLAERVRVEAITTDRPSWLKGAADGLRRLGLDPVHVGIEDGETRDPEQARDEERYSLVLEDGRALSLSGARALITSSADFERLAAQEASSSSFYSWHELAETATDLARSPDDVRALAASVEARLDVRRAASALAHLSTRARALGDEALALKLASAALAQSEPSGWDPWMDGGSRLDALEALRASDARHGRPAAVGRLAQDLSVVGPHRLMHHTERIVPLFFDDLPVLDLWALFAAHLDRLYVSTPTRPLPDAEASLAEPVADDTPSRAVADLVALYLDHPSYSVAARAAQAAAALLAAAPEDRDIIGALSDAGHRSDEALGKVLAALDAVYAGTEALPSSAGSFLTSLRGHPDLLRRFQAEGVASRATGTPLGLVRRGTALSKLYTLVLPDLSHHHTGRESSGELLDDPARVLRPYDLHARGIAEAADVDPDAVLMRAASLAQSFAVSRPWSTSPEPRTPEQLTSLLRSARVMVSHAKPHIVPAERALGHVLGEFWDAGLLSPEVVEFFSTELSFVDAGLLMEAPRERPSWVPLVHDAAPDDWKVPDGWHQRPEGSVEQMRQRTPDGLVVLAERTQAETLNTEPRMSEARSSALVLASTPRPEINAGTGETPFVDARNLSARAYPRGRASVRRLVVRSAIYGAEALGMGWIAFNPGLAARLGWALSPAGLFRWLHEDGAVAAETIWWTDGAVDRHDARTRCMVGEGWLVVASPRALGQIQKRLGPLRQDVVVNRSLGFIGSDGSTEARRSRPLR